MDLSNMWTVGGPIAGAGAVVIARGIWDAHLKRRDRRDERTSQRDEDYRIDLRRAYVEFFVAQHHYLDRVSRAAGLQTVANLMRSELTVLQATFPEPRTAALAEQVGSLVKAAADEATALLTAAALASEKAKAVLLLEDDAAMRKLVAAIDRSETIFYTGEAKWPETEKRYQGQLRDLASLVETLGGTFSPREWYATNGIPKRYVATKP